MGQAASPSSARLSVTSLPRRRRRYRWRHWRRLGGAIFPEQLPTIEGPQLDEKNMQVSTYGKAISIPFGALRMAGNVIWASELRETRTETEQGGKGGGPVQSTVSYSYDADCRHRHR